jgi:hypothetical protein
MMVDEVRCKPGFETRNDAVNLGVSKSMPFGLPTTLEVAII